MSDVDEAAGPSSAPQPDEPVVASSAPPRADADTPPSSVSQQDEAAPSSEPDDDEATASFDEPDDRAGASRTSPGRERRTAGPMISFGFNLGKIPDQGEDSDPIVRTGRDLGLVAVFDGMGGAGGTVYETPDGPRTGAYLASRVARDVVERVMLDVMDPQWHLDGARTAAAVHDAVKDALVERLRELDAPVSKLRSKLLRALPTTMALVALQRVDTSAPRWAAHVLWSGDSRAYVFDPRSGAQQLTTDDLRDRGDAMDNLRRDSVVANAMSADTAFTVNHRLVHLDAPFVVVAATDGCFGYVPSPMHFEHLVLDAMRGADDVDDWSTEIQRRVSEVTGDDAAMATVGVGADFDAFKDMFAARAAELERRFVQPLDELDARVSAAERALADLRDEREARRDQVWSAYRSDYERYLRTDEQGRDR